MGKAKINKFLKKVKFISRKSISCLNLKNDRLRGYHIDP